MASTTPAIVIWDAKEVIDENVITFSENKRSKV
jgi:hypothetical protein